MRIFKINEHIEIVCEAKKTRNGFKLCKKAFSLPV